MKDQRISDSDIMISFDVSSLFTNVPIIETLDYLKEKLEEDSTLEDRTNLRSILFYILLNYVCKQHISPMGIPYFNKNKEQRWALLFLRF